MCKVNAHFLLDLPKQPPFRMNINHFLVPPILRLKLSYIAVRNSVSVCLFYFLRLYGSKKITSYDDRTELTDPSEWLSASA